MNWMNVDESSRILSISLSKVILKVKKKKETAQTFQSVTQKRLFFKLWGSSVPFMFETVFVLQTWRLRQTLL